MKIKNWLIGKLGGITKEQQECKHERVIVKMPGIVGTIEVQGLMAFSKCFPGGVLPDGVSFKPPTVIGCSVESVYVKDVALWIKSHN